MARKRLGQQVGQPQRDQQPQQQRATTSTPAAGSDIGHHPANRRILRSSTAIGRVTVGRATNSSPMQVQATCTDQQQPYRVRRIAANAMADVRPPRPVATPICKASSTTTAPRMANSPTCASRSARRVARAEADPRAGPSTSSAGSTAPSN